MDVFGSVCLAIDLVNKIKGTFGQVGQNSHDCVILSADILKSLLKVKEFWEQNSLYPPEELQESQSEFDRELKAINASLESLIKPAKGGGSIPDLTVLYNADEIQDELDRLLRNVQRCEQELQTWNTLRSESSGSILHPNAIGLIQDQDASMTHLQNELRALVPGLNPERRATLEQIEQVLLDHFRDRNASGYVQQEHDNFQTRNRSQATPLIKSSARPLSPSFVEKPFIMDKVGAISIILPQPFDEVFIQDTFTLFHQTGEPEDTSSNISRPDLVQETLRILKILQSEMPISYIETAKDLLHLGGALRALGMMDQASMMYDWGIQICCKLAAFGTPEILLDLVQFLHKFSLHLESTHQFVDADKVFEQAVKARSQLQDQMQTTHLDTLASFLKSEVELMGKEERFRSCCRLMKEAVEVYRTLSTMDQDSYFHHSGWSLHEFAFYLYKAGMVEEAIKVGDEAIEMRRELVKKDRRNYLSHLGRTLHNHALHLNKIGMAEEAVQVAKEAVDIRRELVEEDRNTHLPDLCSSLLDLASYTSKAGKFGDAVEEGRKAVEMHLELVERKDGRHYLPDFGLSLHNLAFDLNNIGTPAEAVKMAQEAIEVRRELVQNNPLAYLCDLCSSLHELALYLAKAGRFEDAAKAEKEVVEMRWGFVEKDRTIHLPDLCSSVHEWAFYSSKAGRLHDAVNGGREVVAMRRELVEKDRTSYLPDLSRSLHSLAFDLNKIGSVDEAVSVAREAVEICRELVEKDRKTHLSYLSLSMHCLAVQLDSAGKHEDAAKVGRESVELYRELVKMDPSHASNSIRCMEDLAGLLHKMRRHEEAQTIEEELYNIRLRSPMTPPKAELSPLWMNWDSHIHDTIRLHHVDDFYKEQ